MAPEQLDIYMEKKKNEPAPQPQTQNYFEMNCMNAKITKMLMENTGDYNDIGKKPVIANIEH